MTPVDTKTISKLQSFMNGGSTVKTKSVAEYLEADKKRREKFRHNRNQQSQPTVSQLGPRLWAELHTSITLETLLDWEAKIPSLACPCRDAYKIIKKQTPPESYPDFFEWTVFVHNAVNAKLLEKTKDETYQQTTLEQARVLWRNEFPKRSGKAVVTIATGREYRRLLSVTGPTHRAYAERVGADYIQLTNQLCADWKQEKFRAGIVGEQYDQTLFVDCDVIIRDSCQDVFNVGGIYIHDDREKLRMTHWCEGDIARVAESQHVDPWPYLRCLNTGFFTFNRTDNPWVMPTHPFNDSHCAEQWWVDRHINEWTRMDSENNWQWWFYDFWDGIDDANVVHLANCPKDIRVELARKIVAGEQSVSLRGLYFEKWKTSASL